MHDGWSLADSVIDWLAVLLIVAMCVLLPRWQCGSCSCTGYLAAQEGETNG